jgi:hypothetical protein
VTPDVWVDFNDVTSTGETTTFTGPVVAASAPCCGWCEQLVDAAAGRRGVGRFRQPDAG